MPKIDEVLGAVPSPRAFFANRYNLKQRISYSMSVNDGNTIGQPAFTNFSPINIAGLGAGLTQVLFAKTAGEIHIIGRIELSASVAGQVAFQDDAAVIQILAALQVGVDRVIDLGAYGSGAYYDNKDFVIRNNSGGVCSYAGFFTWAKVTK